MGRIAVKVSVFSISSEPLQHHEGMSRVSYPILFLFGFEYLTL